MRDLNKILKLFEIECPMEYCNIFDKVKAILEYCNSSKPLEKLYHRGGNEVFFNEITRRFHDMFLELELVNPDNMEPLSSTSVTISFRKMTLFLILNTDTTYKYNLRNQPDIAHVFELCPLLPKYLLATLIWDLKLDKYFYETLSYTPIFFAFQYFGPAADTLKYVDDPYEVLEKVEQLVRALLKNVTRSILREMDLVDMKNIFSKCYDYTINLLRQFHTPDCKNFQKFNQEQFDRYMGISIKHLLQMIIFGLDVYEDSSMANPADAEEMAIYDFCKDLCKPNLKQSVDEIAAVKNIQEKIINSLLNSLQQNLMLVRLSVFMYWVEIDLTETKNLQMAVGELAYQVAERIAKIPAFAHDVAQQLPQFIIKPQDLNDVIKNANQGEILRKLDEPLDINEKKLWLNELFNRTITFSSNESIETLRDNVNMFSVENCMKILDYMKQISSIKQENNEEEDESDIFSYEEIASLCLLAVENFSIEDIVKMIEYQIEVFGINSTVFCTESKVVDYRYRLGGFFTKFCRVFDLQKFLYMSFEYPRAAWEYLFKTSYYNEDNVNNLQKIMLKLTNLSENYIVPSLNNAIYKTEAWGEKFFPKLVTEIYFTLFYPNRCTIFFKNYINPVISFYLDQEEFEPLISVVQLFKLIENRGVTGNFKPRNFAECYAPVLIMVARIMDVARWDPLSYTNTRNRLVCDCIEFVQSLTKKFLPTAADKDRKYIANNVEVFKPLTQFYYQKFKLKPLQHPEKFDVFLKRFEADETFDVEAFLMTNYLSCTEKEMEWLATNPELLRHMPEAFLLLNEVMGDDDFTPNAICNYRFGLLSFGRIVNHVVIPQVKNDQTKLVKLLMKSLRLIHESPASIYEDLFSNFQDLLLDIVKHMNCEPNSDTALKIAEYVDNMKESQTKTYFKNQFSALLTQNDNEST